MITSETEYQRLLQQQLKSAAPALWNLLNCPFESMVSGQRTGPKTKQQRKALRELARIARFPIPAQLYLEEP